MKIPNQYFAEAYSDPVGIRTRDPLIKSQMLYRLSYEIKTKQKQVGGIAIKQFLVPVLRVQISN